MNELQSRISELVNYLFIRWENSKIYTLEQHKLFRIAKLVKCSKCQDLIIRQGSNGKEPKCDDCRKEENRERALKWSRNHKYI